MEEKKMNLKLDNEIGILLRKARQEYGISLEKLAYKVVSKTQLSFLETGEREWNKLEGDVLLYRMGIWPLLFETYSSASFLDAWRLREDICLSIFEDEEKAKDLIAQHWKIEKLSNMETQFLLKAEIILALQRWKKGELTPEEQGDVLTKGIQAVELTMRPKKDWRTAQIGSGWYSPAELETVLLLAKIYRCMGDVEAAENLQRQVWDYPKNHKWDPRVQEMIIPQTAMVGMEIMLAHGDTEGAFLQGVEALEFLRDQSSQRYALPLMEKILEIWPTDKTNAGELKKSELVEFLKTFSTLYAMEKLPNYRLWQMISVENTYELGLSIKMLRKACGFKKEDLLLDDERREVMQIRHLEKLERGDHMPYAINQEHILKKFQVETKRLYPVIQADNMSTLALCQEVSTASEKGDYEQAEILFQELNENSDLTNERNNQEYLLQQGILDFRKRGKKPEEVLNLFKEAFACTVKDADKKKMNYWVYRRNEMFAKANEAMIYRKMGKIENLEYAQHSLEDVVWSLEQLAKRTQIPYYGYDVVYGKLTGIYSDLEKYEESLALSQKVCWNILTGPHVRELSFFLYDLAWVLNEQHETGAKTDTLDAIREYFSLAKSIALFCKNREMFNLLQVREGKFAK